MTVTKDGTLQEEERGYYSLGDGYAFLLPPNWQTEVTVQNDNLTGIWYSITTWATVQRRCRN